MIPARWLAGVLLAVAACAQQPLSSEEEQQLRLVLSQGASSPVDLIHVLESHLAKFPESPKRHELERGILKAAIQVSDRPRVAAYGDRVLRREPGDLTLLDPVCRAMVLDSRPDVVKAGLEWSKRYEAEVRAALNGLSADTPARGRRKDEMDRMLSHALLFQAIAYGALGENDRAMVLARDSYATYPAADPALELARRYAAAGKTDESIRAYADAFTVPDAKASDADRLEIRRRLGAAFRKATGNEAGLGEIVLQAYDRNAALMAQRRLALKQFDPNSGATDPIDFTLNEVHGGKLVLSTLKGKVVVMDFWATWCGPCRAQHPLYEKVKERFARNADVVFLAIDTDEDRAPVKPFIEEQGWRHLVYFEDGLVRALRVLNIPTTVVLGRDGAVVSRMDGFDPDTFVDVLSQRVADALGPGDLK